MRISVLLLAFLAFWANACDGPTAGEISVELVTPNVGDGAIFFKIETPSSNSLGDVTAACPECRAFVYQTNDAEVYCVITGPLTSGPLVRLSVADVSFRTAYAVTVVAVAGSDHELRSSEEYDLRLTH